MRTRFRADVTLFGGGIVNTSRTNNASVWRDAAGVRAAARRARPCREALVAFAALAVACMIAAPAGWAQTEITDQPERETISAEQAQRATELARDLQATGEFEPVTFAEVLRDPDNVELSFRYARTQVRSDDLHGAVTTLECILFVNRIPPRKPPSTRLIPFVPSNHAAIVNNYG